MSRWHVATAEESTSAASQVFLSFAIFVALFLCCSLTKTTFAAISLLLGDSTVETTLDSDDPGSAEAFQSSASTTGTLGSLTVYLDSASKSTQLIAGIYANAAGHPGTLLSQGSSTALQAGAWNTISIPPVGVSAGTVYWIAILGTNGTLYFRDTTNGSCYSESSTQSNLAALPASWTSGSRWSSCRLSAYGGAASAPSLSVTPASISFNVTQGGSDPPPAQLSVANSGGGALAFSVSTDAVWLAASPSNGTAPQTLQVSTASGLAPNTYIGHVTVSSAGSAGSPAVVTTILTVSAPAPAPVPTLSSLSPSSRNAGGSAFTLTVNGTNFVSGNTVLWNGSALATTFGSSTQLAAAVPAGFIATMGTAAVTVQTAGGGTSNSLNFVINPPVPSLSGLSPSSAPAGGTTFTLTVSGANFVSGDTVLWNEASLATTFSSLTQLTAAVPAGLIGSAGTATIAVQTPAGATSNSLSFSINPAAPVISSLSPSSAQAGGPSFTLLVNGVNFVSGDVVYWNGAALQTGFGSSTQLTASVPATLISTSGTSSVAVVGLAGLKSTSLTFTTVAPATSVARGISINFVGRGTAMAASEAAGVVAKSNWNNASGASRSTSLALIDETGAATNATVTWTSDNVWNTNITDQAGSMRMMNGYLDTGSGHPTTVNVSGLNMGSYDVYLYADGDNGSATRTGNYQISGSGIVTTNIGLNDVANTNFSGTFIQASNSNGNYVKFNITANGFTLTATPGQTSDGTARAPINGIQIVPTSSSSAADFSLSAAPGSQSVIQGGMTSYTVNTAAINGFTGNVSLVVTGLPSGVTGNFTPTTGSVPGTAGLNVTTSTSTPAGNAILRITGTSGVISHSASVTLVVGASQTFSISGTISGGGGATVALSGAASATTTASSSGGYTFGSLGNGTYTVTPSRVGYTFSPSSQSATINGANLSGVNFTATALTFSLSGAITPTLGGSGATVTLSGAASASTTSNSSGVYSFSGLANGSYAVTPSNTGYSFSPSSQAVTVNSANVTAVNFVATATAPTYSISGTISPASAGAGATVTLSGAVSFTTTADASGNFSFTTLSNGTYTLTPSSPTATFSPTSQTVSISNANVSGISFTATATSNVIFFDDFTGTTLSSQWVAMNRAGDYSNSEQECYKPSQVSVSNSDLMITSIAQTATCGDANHSPSQFPTLSGMVQWGTFHFTYGTVEFRAKMAGGQGTWPAIWMLGSNCQASNIQSADNSGACNWPQPGSDEIDITEILSSNHTAVNQQIHSAGNNSGCTASTTDVSQNFHVYQLIWAASSLEWKIDGTSTCKITSGIPSNPMFLIINTAMGGAGGTINNSTLPQTSLVDYVRVSQP